MTPLPIFRLPQLVYIKIINQMSLTEQIFTALCSRRAYALVKNYRNKVFNLVLDIDTHCVSFYHEHKWPSKSLKLFIGSELNWSSERAAKSIDINENRGLRYTIDNRGDQEFLEICWKDRSVGLRNMLELACDLFRIVLYGTVEIGEPEDIWIVDWFKKQQTTPEILVLQNEIPDDDIKHVILNNTAQQLWMNAKATANFQIHNFPNTFGQLSISPGFWITIQNLILLDCIELSISEKKFTCRELNRFLKHWIYGRSSRLKFMRIFMEEFNQNEVFADIQLYLAWRQEVIVFTSPYGQTVNFNGPQLRRSDGQVASLVFVPGPNVLYMGVWF